MIICYDTELYSLYYQKAFLYHESYLIFFLILVANYSFNWNFKPKFNFQVTKLKVMIMVKIQNF